jgi:hypothetical protein
MSSAPSISHWISGFSSARLAGSSYKSRAQFASQ